MRTRHSVAPDPAPTRYAGKASALIIASPEYAHGISGVLKNALDWLVSYEGFVDKPIALVNTSPRARHAIDALHEVLRTMSANILSEASVTVPLLGSCATEEAMLASGEVSESIGRYRDSLWHCARRWQVTHTPCRTTFASLGPFVISPKQRICTAVVLG